ncbi:MAG: SpoIID/LytB domain-containing protein [candidate division FCPU426 bacterium]
MNAAQEVKMYDMRTKQISDRGILNTDFQILARDGRLVLGGKFSAASVVRFVPSAGDFLGVNGKRYRGQIEVAVNSGGGGLQVINYLPLESYVAGVVPNEVSPAWPEEALKVQAIAARTFALYKMSGRSQMAYDLDDSVSSQVYGGVDSERPSTTAAVKATTSVVAMYTGKFIAAFYHSNCGGRTANVREVWGGDMDYLNGVECGFCDQAPHARWNGELSGEDLRRKLQKSVAGLKAVTGLDLKDRDASARVKTVVVRHPGGAEEMKGPVFRMLVGPDFIRSTRFTVVPRGASWEFTGQGWGHGVGLCQEGALGMAQNGYNYRDILRHYYPGIELRNWP